MAGTIVHYKVGINVLNKLNKNIDKDIFTLACQGHDLLYFIKLKDILKFKEMSFLVDILQDNNFSLLVKAFEEEIIKTHSIKLKSFLYGYIVHHLTDSVFHPYIIYQSGFYDEHDPSTKKYKGEHELLESIIDVLYTDDINNIYKVFPKIKEKELNNIKNKVENIFYKIYLKKNVGNLLVNNMKNVRGFLHMYRCDRSGIKRIGYKFIDYILGSNYSFLSYNYPKKYKKIEINKKQVWYNPLDNKREYSSLNDLYEKSIRESLKVLDKIDDALINNKTAEVENISAVTGRLCQNKYQLKYFKN